MINWVVNDENMQYIKLALRLAYLGWHDEPLAGDRKMDLPGAASEKLTELGLELEEAGESSFHP